MRRRAPGVAVLGALAALSLGGSWPVPACIDTYGTDLLHYQRDGDETALREAASKAEQAHRNTPSVEHTNDVAVAWMLTGRLPDAIRLLRELEQRSPGNAIVAGNLGSALERAGDVEEALFWIRESVRRDALEHQGAEWAHVKILEARLGLKRDPHWLRKQSVIGWREGQRMPLDERSQPRSPRRLVESIHYQLEQQLAFVSPPDPVIADLYLTLGDLAFSAAPGAYPNAPQRDAAASSGYGRAIEFGTVHEARARERKALADQRIEAARPAMLAAEQREREAEARSQENARLAEQHRRSLEEAQQSRRLMALVAFGGFGLVVAGALLWHRRRERR